MTLSKTKGQSRSAALALIFCGLLTADCQRTPPAMVTVAPGVVFRRDAGAGVQIVEADLRTARIRPVVVVENIERRRNNFIGDCKTVREWGEKYGAIAGLNATFFGDTYDDLGRRKQIVGLLAREGKIVAPFSFVAGANGSGQKYTRSALAFTAQGKPEIAWATGTLSAPPKRYNAAVNPTEQRQWNVASIAGCGPRLFAAGQRFVSDRDERLVSPGKLSRAFVAYDADADGPRHLLLCRADAMEFSEIADYLTAYFQKQYHSAPEEALCMDGGPSAQLIYRNNGIMEDAEPTGVLVPTAILLLPE